MDAPLPPGTPRQAILRQASLRLAIVLGLFVLLVASATALIHQTVLAQAARERAERLSAFYQTRLADFEQQWAQQIKDLRAHLEQTPVLKPGANGKQPLDSLLRPQGHGQLYSHLLVLDREQRILFSFGIKKADFPRAAATQMQPRGWHLEDISGRLYRVRVEPFALGAHLLGQVVALFPVDRALLERMVIPDTDLRILYQGRVVAASAPLMADPSLTPWQIQRLALPWEEDAASPVRLDIGCRIRPLLTTWELALGVSAMALAEGLILWYVLGLWLLQQARRIQGLERAVQSFHQGGAVAPKLWEHLAGATGTVNDEIRALAVAFSNLMEQGLTVQVELKRALGMFQATVEDAPVAMLLIDRDGKLRMANGAATRLFGLSHAALLDTPVEDLLPERLRTRQQQSKTAPLDTSHARPRPTSHVGEFRARRANGEELDVEIGLTPIETTEGVLVLASLVDISDYKQAQAAIASALEEKTHLLNEVHHRIKNNLQVIASLLSLQAAQVRDPAYRQLLAESEQRVQAMALVHHLLYETQDFAQVNLGEYLQRLAQLLRRLNGADERHIRLEVTTQPLWLELRRAIPCGLIVNELLTNCFKHAFRENAAEKGEIHVSLDLEHKDTLLLVVADNGQGLPDAGGALDSLGMQIIEALAQQMGAQLHRENQNGARVELRFARIAESGAKSRNTTGAGGPPAA